VCLDFRGVEDLAASWIAEALLPLQRWMAAPEVDLYPILTGVLGTAKRWEDDFDVVASRGHAVFLAADEHPPRIAWLLGELDPLLVETLHLVQRNRSVTGAGLKRLVPEEPIGATAWSNRLKDLHAMRLVRRSTRGREQVYSPVLEVDLDGTRNSGTGSRKVSASDAAGGPGRPDADAL
jgi:hypothetical protein